MLLCETVKMQNGQLGRKGTKGYSLLGFNWPSKQKNERNYQHNMHYHKPGYH